MKIIIEIGGKEIPLTLEEFQKLKADMDVISPKPVDIPWQPCNPWPYQPCPNLAPSWGEPSLEPLPSWQQPYYYTTGDDSTTICGSSSC